MLHPHQSRKDRLINLDVGKQAREDSYSYLQLLQLITTAPSHGTRPCWTSTRVSDSRARKRFRAEDAWGPSSGWTMSQASLLLKKICEGFHSTELARLTASVVITVPFQWTTLCDSVLQFQQRVKTSYPEQNVNAIHQKEVKSPTCFKCF